MPALHKLKTILEKHAELILKHNPDLASYFSAMKEEETPARKRKLQESFFAFRGCYHPVKDKGKSLPPLETLILLEQKSVLEDEKQALEVQGVPEQIILYNLFKRYESRRYQSDMQKVMQEVLSFSFEGVNHSILNLQNKIRSSLDTQEFPRLIEAMNRLIAKLPELVWSLGYLQGAIHYICLASDFKKRLKEGEEHQAYNDSLEEKILICREMGLQNIRLDRLFRMHLSFEMSTYIQHIYDMYVPSKDLRDLFQKASPLRETIPPLNDPALAADWIESRLKSLIDKVPEELTIVSHPVDMKAASIQKNLSQARYRQFFTDQKEETPSSQEDLTPPKLE